MADVCKCQCHRQSILEVLNFVGVSVENDIEAVTACKSCENAHCPALLHTRLLTDPEPPTRDIALWVDPPVRQADGEKGDEAGG